MMISAGWYKHDDLGPIGPSRNRARPPSVNVVHLKVQVGLVCLKGSPDGRVRDG